MLVEIRHVEYNVSPPTKYLAGPGTPQRLTLASPWTKLFPHRPNLSMPDSQLDPRPKVRRLACCQIGLTHSWTDRCPRYLTEEGDNSGTPHVAVQGLPLGY